MTIDPNLVALISIIATALVSILSVFVPVLLVSLNNRQNKKDNQLELIKSTTIDLLRNLAPFRHTVYDDIGTSAGRDPVKLHSDLQVSHYAWEQAVWHCLDNEDKERVIKLRHLFESVWDPHEYTKSMQNISDEILQISNSASQTKL